MNRLNTYNHSKLMKNESTTTLCFIGDIFLGDANLRIAPALSEALQQSDLRIANLESPICEPTPTDSSKILLCSRPGCEATLQELEIDFVSLANNHIFDHGFEGFTATRDVLDKIAIKHTGAGDDLEQASKPLLFESNGIRFGLIAATEEKTQARIANQSSYGCNTLDQTNITQQIQTLRSQVDHVIVLPHWGYCDYNYPSIQMVHLGEVLLDAGASAVVGHHSHVVQGARAREGGPYIAYSLGNFFFDDYHITEKHKHVIQGESARGAILNLRFSKTHCEESRWCFTLQQQQTLALDTDSKREKVFAKRSEPLQQVKGYERFWRLVVRKRMRRRALFWLNPARWRQVRIATLVSAFIMLKNVVFTNSKNKTE